MSAVELTRPPGADIFGINTDAAAVAGLYEDQQDLASQEVFMELMMTELQHQDPLDPMENQEFLNQIAMLTSVEQLRAANSNLETLQLYQSSINNAQSVSMMGKTVKASGDAFTYSGEGNVDLDFRLGANAVSSTVTIFDAEDYAVRTIELGQVDSGEQEVTWDGHNEDGSPMGEGEYTYKVTAKDADQNTISTLTFIKGVVEGITFEGGIPFLHIGSHQVTMGEVLEITQE
ncbi:MAG: FlgD immunoglobulin-like domain containing protein [Candidatus Lernaella stagnicola]|nr:FlgD immunoglobulin-like domain containing protein [Candidatus Lernaella stagnicola]